MATQTTSPATATAASTTSVDVAPGDSIGIYTADAGGLPAGAKLVVMLDTPGNDQSMNIVLDQHYSLHAFSAYAKIKLVKEVSAIAYGGYKNTA